MELICDRSSRHHKVREVRGSVDGNEIPSGRSDSSMTMNENILQEVAYDADDHETRVQESAADVGGLICYIPFRIRLPPNHRAVGTLHNPGRRRLETLPTVSRSYLPGVCVGIIRK
jgi:hypothetical protein